MGDSLFEKRAAWARNKMFKILKGFADFDIDSDDELELSAPPSMPCRMFADLAVAVQKSFTAQDPTL